MKGVHTLHKVHNRSSRRRLFLLQLNGWKLQSNRV